MELTPAKLIFSWTLPSRVFQTLPKETAPISWKPSLMILPHLFESGSRKLGTNPLQDVPSSLMAVHKNKIWKLTKCQRIYTLGFTQIWFLPKVPPDPPIKYLPKPYAVHPAKPSQSSEQSAHHCGAISCVLKQNTNIFYLIENIRYTCEGITAEQYATYQRNDKYKYFIFCRKKITFEITNEKQR